MTTRRHNFTTKIVLFTTIFTTICRAQTAPISAVPPSSGAATPASIPSSSGTFQPQSVPPSSGAFQPAVAPPYTKTDTFQSAVGPSAGNFHPGAYPPFAPEDDTNMSDGSAYIPVDSWVYPAVLRLYGFGYMDHLFLGLRPYTRLSLLHQLDSAKPAILADNNDEAVGILNDLLRFLAPEIHTGHADRGSLYGIDSIYERTLGVNGLPLRDSFHIGSSLVNDYGRPYQQGFNSIVGFSTLAERGRFSLYVRGEYQHAPSAPGYTPQLASYLMSLDEDSLCATTGATPPCTYGPIPATIPLGPLAQQDPFRLVEATLSFHLLGNEISGGKSDAWLGPGMGGGMAWSNNAENIYSFRINRVEPLDIPLLWHILGPMRYDFFVGSLKGHVHPNAPWIHAEKLSFHPTRNFEFGFERTIIFGGEGHVPITLGSFFNGFFSVDDVVPSVKLSRSDPGARFASFDVSYRLPFLRNRLTFYTDSFCHDDQSPPTAPRRAGYRPGLYLSHVPGLPHLDVRAEAVSTNPSVSVDAGGTFYYWEVIQHDGYTNKGNLIGDWIGREAKGGQAWLTWHLSGSQFIQVAYLRKKIPTNFISGGTTQNQFRAESQLNLHHDVELDAWVQFEGWKVPAYQSGQQQDTAAAVQFTWHPGLHQRP
jgi:hypothetical protein